MRPAVLAFKEHGRAELARPLGAALALAVAAVVSAVPGRAAPVLLVPVPSSPAALPRRGRDHVRELAGRGGRGPACGGVPAPPGRLLRRRGRVRDSAGLSRRSGGRTWPARFAGPRAPPPAGHCWCWSTTS